MLLALSSARRSVYITNPYLILDDKMRQTLIDLVKRGVRVIVLVPGAIDHNIVRQASRAQFGEMIRGGIEIYEYTPALLHAKTVVIDGVWATIGSTNFDNRSFAGNDELNMILYDRGVARKLEQVFLWTSRPRDRSPTRTGSIAGSPRRCSRSWHSRYGISCKTGGWSRPGGAPAPPGWLPGTPRVASDRRRPAGRYPAPRLRPPRP
jgi:cardiolipin synthase